MRREIDDTDRARMQRQSSRHSAVSPKKRKLKKRKVMSERKKRAIRRFNKLFILAYIIFSIYRIGAYFSWKSLVLPMMKNECSIVIDGEGNIVDTIGGERIKDNVPLSEVPEHLRKAYIDIEDERFYSHKGVDVKRTTAAIGSYVIHGGKSSFGGSTITQQLVKNLTGNDDNSISRKMGEWVKACELESFASKDEILEAYLNIIYVAPNVYGVNAGSKYYFNKEVKDLDVAESAFLAGINISPNSYNPFDGTDNSERIKKRTKTVLDKMHSKNDISDEEYNKAIEEVDNGLAFSKGNLEAEHDGVYSYYTDAVMDEVISEIAKKKHIPEKFATNYVYMSGLTIHSTEDSNIQKILEDEYTQGKYIVTSQNGQTSQSAMVVVDHSNGQVKGVVGGLGKKTTARGFNRATQGYRQTGSAIKPIAVLAPGIDKKIFNAATMYTDEPTTFENDYAPKDNDDYIGNITVRRAVESSQNIPFVKMMEQVTPQTSVKYMKKMGITSLTEKDEALPLALGGLEKGTTPLEMAGAYATIANDGVYIEPTFYTSVTDAKGKTVIKSKQKKRRVFSKEDAFILKQLLKQPVEGANGTARGCKIDGFDVAAKTGTTNDNYDKWLCGFTTYYTAVTWYGYDQCEPIYYKGKSPAVNIWGSVMRNIHSSLGKTMFTKPGSVKQATICPVTGKLASSKCENTYTEYFLPGTLPTESCVACTGHSSHKTTSEPTTKPAETQNTVENQVQSKPENKAETNTTNENTVTVTNVPSNSTNTTSNNTTNQTTSNQNVTNSTSTNVPDEDEEYDDGP